MTLMDAPKYDAARERLQKHIVIAVFVLTVLSALATWWFWNWPEERCVNRFLTTVESGNLTKAYGIWKKILTGSSIRSATRLIALTAFSETGEAAANGDRFTAINLFCQGSGATA